MIRCKRCLLPETYPNISFNEKKICNYCLGECYFGIEKNNNIQLLMRNRTQFKNEFENYIELCKGKSEYDCLLLFSGGKDSIYLLHILKEKYKLNVLAFSVDNGFMNPLAKKNIRKVIKLLNVDHVFFTPGNEFFNKIYLHFLTYLDSETFCDKICGRCSEIIHGMGLIEASKRQIPMVILGNSPDQTDHYFYEIPKEKITESWIPKEFKFNCSNIINYNYFWNPKKGEYIPRFLIPFHVIDYPGEKAIIKEISKLGLVKKKDLNSLKTNCYLGWLLVYLDLNRSGYTPYIKNISKNIQSGNLKCSKFKKFYYNFGIKLLKLNLVKRTDKKIALNQLHLKKKIYKNWVFNN